MIEFTLSVASHEHLEAIMHCIQGLPSVGMEAARTRMLWFTEVEQGFSSVMESPEVSAARRDAMTMIAARGMGIQPEPRGVLPMPARFNTIGKC